MRMDSFHIDGTVSEKLMFSRYANYGSYGSDEPDRVTQASEGGMGGDRLAEALQDACEITDTVPARQ